MFNKFNIPDLNFTCVIFPVQHANLDTCASLATTCTVMLSRGVAGCVTLFWLVSLVLHWACVSGSTKSAPTVFAHRLACSEFCEGLDLTLTPADQLPSPKGALGFSNFNVIDKNLKLNVHCTVFLVFINTESQIPYLIENVLSKGGCVRYVNFL